MLSITIARHPTAYLSRVNIIPYNFSALHSLFVMNASHSLQLSYTSLLICHDKSSSLIITTHLNESYQPPDVYLYTNLKLASQSTLIILLSFINTSFVL